MEAPKRKQDLSEDYYWAELRDGSWVLVEAYWTTGETGYHGLWEMVAVTRITDLDVDGSPVDWGKPFIGDIPHQDLVWDDIQRLSGPLRPPEPLLAV